MKISQIQFKKFRCFTDFSVDLKPGINLFVGDNASGKTSLLRGCKYVMSSFFSGFSTEYTRWIKPIAQDFQVTINHNGIKFSANQLSIRFTLDAAGINGDTTQITGEIKENSKKKPYPLLTPLAQLKKYGSWIKSEYFTIAEQRLPLPLFACYRSNNIRSNVKIERKLFRDYNTEPTFGYYECIDGNGLASHWRDRLLVLEEGRDSQEVHIVTNAVIKALGPEGCNIIDDVYIRPYAKGIYFRYIDGREINAELLSDGYRRLSKIVIDLAFRCAILNRGIYGEHACARTQGIVIIDEIDLHLHPALQATILTALRTTFPDLQFIVSTHSPMVMSGVKADESNQIIKLSYKDNCYTANNISAYGLDLSTISRRVLEVTPRNKETAEQITRLYQLLDHEDYDTLKTEIEKMRDIYGESLQEIAEIEATMHFQTSPL